MRPQSRHSRGKPQDNALVEAFNRRFRQECFDEHWFLSVTDAQEQIEAWRNHYNAERPHSSPGNLAPEDFARASAGGNAEGGRSAWSAHRLTTLTAPQEAARARLRTSSQCKEIEACCGSPVASA